MWYWRDSTKQWLIGGDSLDIYLTPQNGQPFRLPVNPSQIDIQRDKRYETLTIIGKGEVDFAQPGTKITQISFSSFFPITYDPSYCNYADIPDPQQAMNTLTAMMNSANPVRLIITDSIINTLVTVAAHKSSFVGGEPGDVYYDLSLRVYQEVKVRSVSTATTTTPTTQNTQKTRTDNKPIPKTYVVKSGDNLYTIAKTFGISGGWQALYNKNSGVIGANPDLIYPGQKLVIP